MQRTLADLPAFEIVYLREPLPHQRRLMEALGVRVRVDPSAARVTVRDLMEIDANTLTATRLCKNPGCAEDEAASDFCRRHTITVELVALKALARKWSREEIIAAIKLWAERHEGKPPLSSDWQCGERRRGAEYPSYGHVVKVFCGWGDALSAAGFASAPSTAFSRPAGVSPARPVAGPESGPQRAAGASVAPSEVVERIRVTVRRLERRAEVLARARGDLLDAKTELRDQLRELVHAVNSLT